MHAWTFSSAVVAIEEASTFTISHEGSGKLNTLAIPLASHSIDWKLIFDLPVISRRDALEKIRWYSQRWKIEPSTRS
jgi:hypothetical protein